LRSAGGGYPDRGQTPFAVCQAPDVARLPVAASAEPLRSDCSNPIDTDRPDAYRLPIVGRGFGHASLGLGYFWYHRIRLRVIV